MAVTSYTSRYTLLYTTSTNAPQGWRGNGQLGYGITSFVGDDEAPAALGDVPVF